MYSIVQGELITVKRIFGLSVTLILLLFSSQLFAAHSALYPEDWDPLLSDGQGRFLHDFSYAGYHYGAPDLPDTDGLPVFDVAADYGADPTGNADGSASIQQAINDAQAAGGGIVFFPAGQYRCDSPLIISASRIVLRGAGSDASFLFFTSTPLSNGKSHILFQGAVGTGADKPLSEDAENRSFTLSVDDADGLNVGDDVVIGWEITDDFIEEHGMTGTWVAFNGSWVPVFRRTITAIDLAASPKRITVDVPLRYPVRVRDRGSVRKETGYLEECVVEDLAFSNAVEVEQAWSRNQTRVLEMQGVKHSYLRRVASFESPFYPELQGKHLQSCGFKFLSSKAVTVEACVLENAQNRGDGGNGYLFEVSQSGEILFRDCIARNGRHNFIQNWGFGTSGVVWLRCESSGSAVVNRMGGLEIATRAYSEYHHSLSMACLVDSCLFHDGWSTGNRRDWSTGAGHTATETVLWNTRGDGMGRILSFNYGQGYVIGTDAMDVHTTQSVVAGALATGTEPYDYTEFINGAVYLRPQSLYESQRSRRLHLPELDDGPIPTAALALHYGGPETVSAGRGQPLTLHVDVEHAVDAVQYQWYRVDNAESWQPLPGGDGPTLVFDALREEDEGVYCCIVTDALAQAQFPFIHVELNVVVSLRPILSLALIVVLCIQGCLYARQAAAKQ